MCRHTTDNASAAAAFEMTNTNSHSRFTWRFTLALLAKLAHTVARSLFDFDSCNRSPLGCTNSRRSCPKSSHEIESQLRELPLPHTHTSQTTRPNAYWREKAFPFPKSAKILFFREAQTNASLLSQVLCAPLSISRELSVVRHYERDLEVKS
jgi:hypothetical protein